MNLPGVCIRRSSSNTWWSCAEQGRKPLKIVDHEINEELVSDAPSALPPGSSAVSSSNPSNAPHPPALYPRSRQQQQPARALVSPFARLQGQQVQSQAAHAGPAIGVPLYPAQHARLPMGMAPRPPPNHPFRSTAQGFPGGDAADGSHASMAALQGQWPVGDSGAPPGGHQGITPAVHSGRVHHLAHHQQQQQQQLAMGGYALLRGPAGFSGGTPSLAPGGHIGLQSAVPTPPPTGHPRTHAGPMPALMGPGFGPIMPTPHNVKVRHCRPLLFKQACFCIRILAVS